jgi:hypothetical protein
MDVTSVRAVPKLKKQMTLEQMRQKREEKRLERKKQPKKKKKKKLWLEVPGIRKG